jgi:hypothetical protein
MARTAGDYGQQWVMENRSTFYETAAWMVSTNVSDFNYSARHECQ